MKKYKFRLSETNWVEFTQKELDSFKDVNYIDDNTKGKIIPINRAFDNGLDQVIAPLELLKHYSRTYENFDKCMACFEDIIVICQKQQNYEIAERIKTLLSELELAKENEK